MNKSIDVPKSDQSLIENQPKNEVKKLQIYQKYEVLNQLLGQCSEAKRMKSKFLKMLLSTSVDNERFMPKFN